MNRMQQLTESWLLFSSIYPLRGWFSLFDILVGVILLFVRVTQLEIQTLLDIQQQQPMATTRQTVQTTT